MYSSLDYGDGFMCVCVCVCVKVHKIAHFKCVQFIMQQFIVNWLSHVRLFATLWTAAHQASLSITNSWSLLKLMSIVCDAIQPSNPLSSISPPAVNLSQHQGLF